MLVVLIIICFGALVVWTWIKPRQGKPPILPGALPFLGHILALPRNPARMWDWEKNVYDHSLRNGGIVTVFVGTHPFYFLSDPDDSLHVANTCLSKPYLYNFAKDLYNHGLNTADEQIWKRHRKLLNPAFNIQILNSLLDVFNDQARNLVNQLATETGKNDTDLETYLSQHFIKTTCHTMLGLNPNDASAIIKDYAVATEDVYNIYLKRTIKFWLHIQFIFNRSSLKKKHDLLVKTVKDISNEVIHKRKLQIKQKKKEFTKDSDQNSVKFRPLLERMLDFTGTEDEFTDDEIRDHVNTMVGAAYSTSAKSILFTLILVGSHEDVQSRILKELNEVFGKEDRNVNKVDLQKLVYLEAVIKESMRLPSVPRVARYNHKEVKLKNFTLRAGSTSVLSLHAINRHPMWGADADQFRPERWLDPASLPDNPNAFASFSLGKRNCIGKLQAMMMMKITLVHILRQYSVKSTSHDLKTQCDLLQSPAAGHKIKIQHRNGY